jgi:drug/metabolite transporter (DMT)-like permease
LGIAFGLLAAAFYGAADFFGGLASKRSSVFSVVMLSQLVGLLLLAAALPFTHAALTHRALLFGFAAGACGAVGIALLYRALAIGKMGVVSPITAVLAAAVPVIVGVFARGEHLTGLRSAGIAAAFVAVVLITLTPGETGSFEFSAVGVREAVISGLALSGFYVFLALAGKNAGLYPLISARCASTGLLLIAALAAGQSIKPVKGTALQIIVAGVLDQSANAFYLFAANAGYLAIAAVLTSLYPASTVILARVVLHERLAAIQKAGVGLALAGVALIAS